MSTPPEAATSAAGATRRELSKGAVAIVVGGATLIAAAFLPWATVAARLAGSVSVNGMDGDGKLTVGLGALVLIFGFVGLHRPHSTAVAWTILGAIAAAAIAIYHIVNVTDVIDRAASTVTAIHASVGEGLYLTVVGACVAFVGALVKSRENQAPVGNVSTSSAEAPAP